MHTTPDRLASKCCIDHEVPLKFLCLFITVFAAMGAVRGDAAPATKAKHASKIIYYGNIRSFYHTRSFQKGTNQYAFSLGGNFHVEGDLFQNFGAGLTYGSANPLGSQDPNPKKRDTSLSQFAGPVSVLEEAYGQYHTPFVSLRVGRQIIKTPWAHASDSRIIPNAFQGVSASAKASSSLTFFVDRMVRFKSRPSATFDANDLLSNKFTRGVLAAGAVYSQPRFAAQAWYYDFYDTARMGYVDAIERFQLKSKYHPFVAAQYVAEAGDTHRLSANVNAHGYGVNVGVANDRGDLSLSYNNVPFRNKAFNSGGIASPYTFSDTDPLYTTSTGTGLIDKGAGHAYRGAVTVWSYHNKFRAIASRAEYYLYSPATAPNNHVLATNLDVTYFLGNGKKGDAFHGFSLRDRWIDIDTPGSPLTFINNRAQLEYDF
ncbi:MAG: OprD family outer membrane porin [Candidatus Eremiobacter antarcticus]|nr:outer membrane porin, OprD family [Candidatus Eremiobacteraeota bacterium]